MNTTSSISECKICKNSGQLAVESVIISLVNGDRVHEACHARLVEERSHKIAQTEAIFQEIQSCESFFRRLFGGDERKKRIADLKELTNQVDREIARITTELTKCYDYWPEYPPDWDMRRAQKVSAAGRICQSCRGRGELHVHHIKEISRGGSHLYSNLKTICRKCHEEHHPWMENRDTREHRDAKRGPYRSKLDLINEALAARKRITFTYTNYKGETTRRTIAPRGFIRPGEPYSSGRGIVKNLCINGKCELRNATRCFNISKMRNVAVMAGGCS